tara:strand:+ start:614 stop:1147 length:534 start_codon:yes stop_codon:yes gene_type:complete
MNFINIIVQAVIVAYRAILALNLKTKVKPKLEPGASPQRVSDTTLIREFEGLRLEAYRDIVGVFTIGYGHTKTAKLGMKITERGAEELLITDLKWVEETINKNVKFKLTQNQYDALASFIYNVGGTAFVKSTMLKKLNASDYDGASKEFRRWNKAGGQVINGLVRRRRAEQKMFNRK